MDVFECIRTRRSVRKYLIKQVEWDKVGQILDAGRMAPSSGNLQNWQFLVVIDELKKKQIAEASARQYWMANASVLMIVCEKPEITEKYYGIRGTRLYSIQNCAAAIENMLLMAHALGLATCWVGAFDEEKVKRVCSIPDRARPQAIISIGYADEKPEMPPKLTLENVTFLNRYGENAGRILDLYGTLGFTSHHVEGAFKRGKEIIDTGSEKLEEKSKGFFEKLKEKLKKK